MKARFPLRPCYRMRMTQRGCGRLRTGEGPRLECDKLGAHADGDDFGYLRLDGVQRAYDAGAITFRNVQEPAQDHQRGQAARNRGCERCGSCHEGMGYGEGRYALHALVPASFGHYVGEARQLSRPVQRRARHHELFWKRADPRRTGRIEASLPAACAPPFEARGYTAWDPTSYAFIKDEVLCIPTAF